MEDIYRAIGHGIKFGAAAMILILAVCSSVYASEPVFRLEIPAVSASNSLDMLAEKTGHSLFYLTDELTRVTTNALGGSYTLPEALDVLLKGTSLNAVVTEKGVIVVSSDAFDHKQNSRGEDKVKAKKQMSLAQKISTALLSIFGASEVVAEEVAESQSGAFGLEEIVVTAQKRSQSLQDVPISISAFTANDLKNSGIETTADLQLKEPSLVFGQTAHIGLPFIRGLGTELTSIGLESTIATHVDGVYLPRPTASVVDFYDIERVEVLKGPQGTLYGRNATGGVVNIINKRPEYGEFGGYLDATFGNFDTRKFEGAMNLPVGEDLAFRVSTFTHQNSGFGENIFLDEPTAVIDVWSIRAQVAYKPSENFEARVIGSYVEGQRGGGSRQENNLLPTITPVNDIRKVAKDTDSFSDIEDYGVSVDLVWEMDNFQIKSLTSYHSTSFDNSVDFDLVETAGAASGSSASSFFTEESDSFIQELQILSKNSEKLEWVAGLFYFYEDANQALAAIRGDGRVGGDIGNGMLRPSGAEAFNSSGASSIETTAYAVFGQATYKLAENFRLNLGLRYSYEEKSLGFQAYFSDVPVPGPSTLIINQGLPPRLSEFPAEKETPDWSAFTPKLGIDYYMNDNVMFWGSVTKGFKSGGTNSRQVVAGRLEVVDPEEIWSYEVGVKSTLFDGRLNLNVSGFYYDYSDIQQNIIPAANISQGITFRTARNLDGAEVKGLEASYAFAATENLTFDGGFLYMKSELEESDLISDTSAPGGTALSDINGNSMSRAPEITFTLGGEFAIPVGGGEIILRGEYFKRSEYFFTIFEHEQSKEGGYDLYNARLIYNDAEGRWNASLFVNNLTDAEYRVQGLPFSNTQGDIIIWGEPRTYGVQLGVTF